MKEEGKRHGLCTDGSLSFGHLCYWVKPIEYLNDCLLFFPKAATKSKEKEPVGDLHPSNNSLTWETHRQPFSWGHSHVFDGTRIHFLGR